MLVLEDFDVALVVVIREHYLLQPVIYLWQE